VSKITRWLRGDNQGYLATNKVVTANTTGDCKKSWKSRKKTITLAIKLVARLWTDFLFQKDPNKYKA